jgi:hypothetical protein
MLCARAVGKAIARGRVVRHVSAATNTHAKTEKLLAIILELRTVVQILDPGKSRSL